MLTDEQRAAGWIEHDGGPCPVPMDSKPGVMFGDGYQEPSGLRTAGYRLVGYWTHHFQPREHIIAYRPEGTPDAD